MLKRRDIERLTFIDIETVPLYQHFDEMDEVSQTFWSKALRQYLDQVRGDKESSSASDDSVFYEVTGGLVPEFSRVICVSLGQIQCQENGANIAHIETFYSSQEKELLEAVYKALTPNRETVQLCGHNIKSFDIPFLAKRMLIHRILPLPSAINTYGKKPWDITHIDTLEIWRMNQNRSYAGLSFICHALGIPSPKDEMDGSQVASYYWKGDVHSIIKYCQQDVQAIMSLILYMSNLEPLAQVTTSVN